MVMVGAAATVVVLDEVPICEETLVKKTTKQGGAAIFSCDWPPPPCFKSLLFCDFSQVLPGFNNNNHSYNTLLPWTSALNQIRLKVVLCKVSHSPRKSNVSTIKTDCCINTEEQIGSGFDRRRTWDFLNTALFSYLAKNKQQDETKERITCVCVCVCFKVAEKTNSLTFTQQRWEHKHEEEEDSPTFIIT